MSGRPTSLIYPRKLKESIKKSGGRGPGSWAAPPTGSDPRSSAGFVPHAQPGHPFHPGPPGGSWKTPESPARQAEARTRIPSRGRHAPETSQPGEEGGKKEGGKDHGQEAGDSRFRHGMDLLMMRMEIRPGLEGSLGQGTRAYLPPHETPPFPGFPLFPGALPFEGLSPGVVFFGTPGALLYRNSTIPGPPCLPGRHSGPQQGEPPEKPGKKAEPRVKRAFQLSSPPVRLKALPTFSSTDLTLAFNLPSRPFR